MAEHDERQQKRLSTEGRQLLARIAASIGKTADVLWGEEYDRISPEYARGYLDGMTKQARDDEMLLMYFVSKMFF